MQLSTDCVIIQHEPGIRLDSILDLSGPEAIINE